MENYWKHLFHEVSKYTQLANSSQVVEENSKENNVVSGS